MRLRIAKYGEFGALIFPCPYAYRPPAMVTDDAIAKGPPLATIATLCNVRNRRPWPRQRERTAAAVAVAATWGNLMPQTTTKHPYRNQSLSKTLAIGLQLNLLTNIAQGIATRTVEKDQCKG